MKQGEWDKLHLPIGEAVFLSRIRLGLTHKGLAAKTGIHRNTLSSLERGEYTPSLRVITQISFALGIEVSRLFKRAEKIRPNTPRTVKLRDVDDQLRRRAWDAVGRAIRNGRLVRRPCDVCGVPESQAHHADYRNPLDVRWLCHEHHMVEHRKIVEDAIPAQ